MPDSLSCCAGHFHMMTRRVAAGIWAGLVSGSASLPLCGPRTISRHLVDFEAAPD